jgi:hypothetical protein
VSLSIGLEDVARDGFNRQSSEFRVVSVGKTPEKRAHNASKDPRRGVA